MFSRARRACASLSRKGSSTRYVVHQAVRRLVGIVRHLHGETASRPEFAHQARHLLAVVGDPLEDGVGKNEVDGTAGPLREIAALETPVRQAAPRGGQHILRRIEAEDVRLRVAAREQLGGISRPAAEVDDARRDLRAGMR